MLLCWIIYWEPLSKAEQPRGLGTAGLMSRDLYLGEAGVVTLFIV